MSQKELLYLEDALEHERIVITFLEEASNNIKEEDTRDFLLEEMDEHISLKEDLMELLKEKKDE